MNIKLVNLDRLYIKNIWWLTMQKDHEWTEQAKAWWDSEHATFTDQNHL